MAILNDDLDIPIDVVLEGDLAGPAAAPRPATAASKPAAGVAAAKALVALEETEPIEVIEELSEPVLAAPREPETKKELLERLLAQVKERRRPRSAA